VPFAEEHVGDVYGDGPEEAGKAHEHEVNPSSRLEQPHRRAHGGTSSAARSIQGFQAERSRRPLALLLDLHLHRPDPLQDRPLHAMHVDPLSAGLDPHQA
jgi:hypothetical protein